ncbi:hypothetical protein HZB01_02995 [Candidatus Woesearchaeota archaeon]|nr:hypothetical protein [Candidatus Woesearchaeota archaeon]
MAATPKGAQKVRVDYNIDKQVHDDFVRACQAKGYAPQIVAERVFRKFVETGQM